MHEPLAIDAYVLAGGRSSRMGRDKALLELAGKPLVAHALTKLRRIGEDVAILSNNDELAQFAPVVKDLHPDCGPMSGIEAALAHARHDWSLVVPVDVPFLPTAFLQGWARMTMMRSANEGTRLGLFRVDDIPQPTLLMIHQDVLPYLTASLEEGKYKLFPVLEAAALDLAQRGRLEPSRVLRQFVWKAESRFSTGASELPGPAWSKSTPAQEAASALYFANLNTPQEFAEAEKHAKVLDT
jgi:molybdopterin-guanine dinucleotide biosynthesis protein A